MAKSFKDLVAFQRALDVVVAVYDVTARFPKAEMYGLVSQLRRAAIGVVSNIGEGQGRLTYGEWRKFLSDARGSLYEVEAQCIAAERLHFMNERELQELTRLIRRAGRALSGLIEWVRSKERSTKQPSNSATKQPISGATPAAPRNPQAPAPRSSADQT
jgi:four helix bundle protein